MRLLLFLLTIATYIIIFATEWNINKRIRDIKSGLKHPPKGQPSQNSTDGGLWLSMIKNMLYFIVL